MTPTRRRLLRLLAVPLGIAAALALSRTVQPGVPAGLGPREDGRLADCPGSPNCVTSTPADAGHAVDAFPLTGSPDVALRRLEAVLAASPRTRVVDRRPGYLRAEATSLVFGFIDDVEFLVAPDGRSIRVRSASRVGHSDLGVNRARVERIRAAFLATGG